MARRPGITQADVAHIVKGVLAAGVDVGRIEFYPVLGTVVVVFGTGERQQPEARGSETEDDRNDFDE